MRSQAQLQIILPVHSEAESISETLHELYKEISPLVDLEFIICEDGSKDDTKNVLRGLTGSLPLKLILSDDRKGYSRAVIDGMQAADAPFVLCLDSDGQCDPLDFHRFWERRNEADIVMGWRTDRADTLPRKLMSGSFRVLHSILHGVPLHDPSCPYMLAKRSVVKSLAPEMGLMQQGFWWEYTARAHRNGYSFLELPVHHRMRSAGKTQVYRLKKLPGIAFRHILALFQIRGQVRHLPAATADAALHMERTR